MVCTGNTCRSPMAAALLSAAARARGRSLDVESAGISPFPDASIAAETVETLREIGVAPLERRACALDEDAVHRSDVILAMERWHLDRIVERHPEAKAKTHLVIAFAGGAADEGIPDPYGLSVERYRSVRDRLRTVAEGVLDRLDREAVR